MQSSVNWIPMSDVVISISVSAGGVEIAG